MEEPGPGLEDADMVPLLLHPETLHSLKLAPTPRPQDHSTDLTCRVNLQGSQVTMDRAIQLNVSYAPRNLHISLPFRNVTESQAPQLLCVADSHPPAQLSWFPGSPALEAAPNSSTRILDMQDLGPAEREFTW